MFDRWREKTTNRRSRPALARRATRARRPFSPHLEPLEERALLAALQGGNLVVFRVGDGVGVESNTGNPVFLDEYTPAGVLVQSIAMPTTDVGANHALVASGTATSEGGLARSGDGRFLTLTGYDATLPHIGALNTGFDPRTIGRVAVDGTIDTSTIVSDFPVPTADNPRSVISQDGSQFWLSAGKSGLKYVTLGGAIDNDLSSSSSTTSFRTLSIYNGQLYVSSQTTGFSVASVGTGIPTSGTPTITNLPGMPTSSSVNSYFFAHLDTTVPGSDPDTLYITDDTGGSANGRIRKYSLVAGTWTLNGSVDAPVVRGLAGVVDSTGATPVVSLYGTTGGGGSAGGGSIYAYSDPTGFNQSPTGTVTTIATAPANEAFRGIAFAPNVAPLLNTSVVPALDAINEDVPNASNPGTLVSDIIARLGGSKISDPGQNLQGLAITSVSSAQGTWQFTTDNGSNWLAFGSPSSTSARLLASNPNTRVRFVPSPDFNGSVSPAITFRAWDQSVGTNGGVYTTSFNGSYSAFSTATLTSTLAVNSVNDAPTFVKGADQSLVTNAGAQTIPGWATAILAGPANESGQTLNFMVTGNTNPGLFSAAPAVNATNGNLTFTPSGASGTATITLVLKDNGGTANGGVDTSAPQTFTITFSGIGANQPPQISAPATTQTSLEDVALVFSSGNGNLISFSDVDALAGDSEQITLNSVGGTLTLNTTSGLTGSGNGSASFTYTGTIANLNAALAGLTFTPTANLNGLGVGSVQLIVSDLGHNGTGGAQTDTVTIPVNLTAVNDAPSFTKGPDKTVAEDTGAQSFVGWATSISAGPSESGQALNFIVSNNNPTLFSVPPSISPTGTLIFTPAPNANGTTTVSVQLHDDGGTANGGFDTSAIQTFQIVITAVNDAPTISYPTATLKAVADVGFSFSKPNDDQIELADVDNAGGDEQFTLTAANGTIALATLAGLTGSGNGGALLTYTGSLAALNQALNGLVFTPASGYTGPASVQVTANDLGHTGSGGAQSSTVTANLDVVPVSPLLINEVFFNPPGDPDQPNVYIELRSPLQNNYAIPNGTYLISVASEDITDGFNSYPRGTVVDTFDLSGKTTGSNGFLVLLEKTNPYALNGLIQPGTSVYDNTGIGTGAGFGNNLGQSGSSIVGHNSIVRAQDVNIKKSSVTYLLVQTDPINNPVAPYNNLDPGATGTLHGSKYDNFAVFDSIGVIGASDNTPGDIGYGYLNYSNMDGSTNQFTPNSQTVPIDFTPVYIGRNGNSLGWQASDWVATGDIGGVSPNFTLDPGNDTVPDSYAGAPLNHIGSANLFVPANAVPTLDLDGGTPGTGFVNTWNNTGAVRIANQANASITDTDSPNLVGMTVKLSNPWPGDVLAADVSGTAVPAPTFDGETLTFSGTASRADYETVLRRITYNNTTGNPGGVSSLILHTKVDDGVTESDYAVTTILISAVTNNAPVIDLNGGVAGVDYTNGTKYTVHGTARNIADSANATVNDDSGNLSKILVTLNSPLSGDTLAANNSAVPAINVNFAGNVLTLSGANTVANYQAVLRTVTYSNSNFNGPAGATTRSVTVVATDNAGTPLDSAPAIGTVNIASAVAKRQIFYNNSKFDGNGNNGGGVSTSDDLAIATDKTAYLPGGGASTFSNMTSFNKGINGVMIDLSGPHAASLVASDFIFRVGNNNTPNSWVAPGAGPIAISIRPGAGTSGSDRVEIIWADNVIQKQWLEVIVKSGANTGLVDLGGGYPAGQGDVFFFGNAIGNVPGVPGGDNANFAIVGSNDQIQARANVGVATAVTNLYDFDRNKIVNSNDELIARGNVGNVRFIVVANPPLAPEGGDAPTASPAAPTASPAVASDRGPSLGSAARTLAALAGTGGGVQVPSWLRERLASIDLNTGLSVVTHSSTSTHAEQADKLALVAAHAVDALHLDEELLAEILADLA